MKALFFTLLIFAAAFLGYDYFMAPPGTKVVFKSLNIAAKKHDDGPVFKSAPVEDNVTAPAKETPAGTAASSPPPAAVTSAPSPDTPPTAKPKVEANGFMPPTYDPIEKLTTNWTKVPSSAFPRPVHLAQDVQFKMGAGTSKMAAGAPVVALAFDNSAVTVAPTEQSPARATVPLEATDLKSNLVAAYEDWKPKRTAYLRELYAKKQAALKAQGVFVAPTGSLDATGMPTRNPDGSYPLLLASIASEQVTEITKTNIHSWGPPNPTKVDGRDGWSIKVNYDAKTIFGPMPVDAQAVVVSGKVKGWYYIGSGEEVP